MAGSLVCCNMEITLPPRSQTAVYNKYSTSHQPIRWHYSNGAPFYSNRRLEYHSNNNKAAKIITKSRRNVVVCFTVPPEVEIPFLPSSIGFPDSWEGWLVGALFTIGLPFLTNKWGPLLGWIDKFKGTLQSTEDIAEAVEDIAEKVDKITEDIEAKLPQGKLKNALHFVELAAEEVAKEADRLDHFIDSVQEMEEKVEALIEEGNEVAREVEKVEALMEEVNEVAKEVKTPKQI